MTTYIRAPFCHEEAVDCYRRGRCFSLSVEGNCKAVDLFALTL